MRLERSRTSSAKKSRRLVLEALDDRSVPAILLSNLNQVTEIDGFTGQQRALDLGSNDVEVRGVAVAASGETYVLDGNDRQVIRIDPATGDTSVISTGYTLGSGLGGIAVGPNGDVFVSDRVSGNPSVLSIIRFSPPATPGGSWSVATGTVGTRLPAITHLSASADGSLFAIDEDYNLLLLTVSSGSPVPVNREVIPTGLTGAKPLGIVAGPNGSVYMVNDGGTAATTGVFHLSPGNATFPWFNIAIATGGLFVDPRAVTTLPGGNLLVPDTATQSGQGAILRIAPSGGTFWTQSVALTGIQNAANIGIAYGDAVVAAPGTLQVTEDVAASGRLTTITPGFRSIQYSIASQPTKGTVTLDDPVTGRYTYTPSANATGSDSFTFRVIDGGVPTAPATVNVQITPVNDPPTVTNTGGTRSLLEDTTYIDNVRQSASDIDGDPLSFAVLMPPSHGTVSMTTNGTFTYTPRYHYNGPDEFQFGVSDGKGGFATGTVNLSILETIDPPVISPGGPFNSVEGGSLQLDGEATSLDGRGMTYSWDINADGSYEWSGLLSPALSITWAELLGLGVIDSGTYAARLRVDDGRAFSVADMSFVVGNTAPVASVSGPTLLPRGGSGGFNLGALDIAPADNSGNFSYSIEWGDGTTSDLTGPSVHQATHVYAVAGSFTVRVTASDKDLGTSTVVTHQVEVRPTLMQPNALDSTKTDLHIGGTNDDDAIVLRPTTLIGEVEVLINGVSLGISKPTGLVVVEGLDGNDQITLQNRRGRRYFPVPVVLRGGDGNDTVNVSGSARNNFLLGGAGNDTLTGGNGRDVLVGGNELDLLTGGLGEDIIVGGRLNDESTLGLQKVMAEWGRTDRTTSDRITDLQTGGILAARDDGATDSLFGGTGVDWLIGQLADPARDLFSDRVATEVLTNHNTPPSDGEDSDGDPFFNVRVEAAPVAPRSTDVQFILRTTAYFPWNTRPITYRIKWGDGTTQQVTGSDTYFITHRFEVAGTYKVEVTAQLQSGQMSQMASHQLEVWATRVMVDAIDPSHATLHVQGTSSNDSIVLRPASRSGGVLVEVNGTTLPPFFAVNRVVVDGQSGNDVIRVQTQAFGQARARMNLPVLLIGGEGDDTLDSAASLRDNILDGGDGNDSLIAGSGWDVLVGGAGRDFFFGGAGADLLASGVSTGNVIPESFLTVSVEWTRRNRSYNQRIATLLQPGYLSLLDDGVEDVLFGGANVDWLIGRTTNPTADLFRDRIAGEVRTALA